MTITAIETRYAGCRFRSRLEARWAVFFDHLGIEWEYEPQGLVTSGGKRRYLPDFYLPRVKAWVEVKGDLAQLDQDLMCDAVNDLWYILVLTDIPRVDKGIWPVHGFVMKSGTGDPHDMTLEQMFLSALMHSFGRDTVRMPQCDRLEISDAFYRPAHALIYEAITSVMDAGSIPSLGAVSEALTEVGNLARAGGVDYLAKLRNAISTPVDRIDYLARSLQAMNEERVRTLAIFTGDGKFDITNGVPWFSPVGYAEVRDDSDLRLYFEGTSNSGLPGPFPDPVHDAYIAARSARFEHGESG